MEFNLAICSEISPPKLKNITKFVMPLVLYLYFAKSYRPGELNTLNYPDPS